MRRRLAVAAVAVSCAASGGLGACGDGSHVYLARRYEEARDCLAPATSVDVLAGDPAAQTCAPACLASDGSGGLPPAVYVSTVCPPYPPKVDVSARDPLCAPALAAQARGDFCLADGGSMNPAPIADAGSRD